MMGTANLNPNPNPNAHQVSALLRMIERDGKKLDVQMFLDRFQVCLT